MKDSAEIAAAALADAHVLSPGTRLGKYELLRRIAVGGMAEIYLARATGIEGFEKLVVLKRILPQHAGNEEFIRMFLDEARLAATLHHPNIAQVYDIGVIGGSYFFTMEYVHGEDLRNILRAARKSGRGLPLEHALSIVIGTSAGLHHAHEKIGPNGRPLGIVHRDVSPSNILSTYDGCIKVVDFGIAKAASRQSETRAGTLKGKIAYMSPEQCRGERLDRRSDVFSIGILLFELTTGTRLYDADNEFAIMNQIVYRDAPRPASRRPGYPSDLEPIVLKALRRNRDERFASAQDLQIELENFAREHRLAVSPVSLARYMEELFAAKLEAFRQAQRAGGSLVDHVTGSVEIDPVPEESSHPSAERANGSAYTPEGALVDAPLGDKTNPSVSVPEHAPLPRSRARLFAIGGGIATGLVVAAIIVATNMGTNDRPSATGATRVSGSTVPNEAKPTGEAPASPPPPSPAASPSPSAVAQASPPPASPSPSPSPSANAVESTKEKAAREKAERERAEQERIEREKAEKERLLREKQERVELAKAERAEREKAEKAEREKAEREKAEKAEREKAERAEREKAEKAERAEREKAEKAERDKAAREKAAREKAEREKAEREKANTLAKRCDKNWTPDSPLPPCPK